MTNKKAPTEVEAETKQGHPTANDGAAQRELLYAALLKGSITTVEARPGRFHRVARYVLLAKGVG